MKALISNITIQVNQKTYHKDPESSTLGGRIVAGSIDLIDDLGFESFTFRKLGKSINSPEASIYRYFESKHKLLLYLTNWYWGWMEYRLVFTTANIDSPEERLERSIALLTEAETRNDSGTQLNTDKLHRLVISESSKAYLTKEVDEENRDGVFRSYKQLVARVADIILEINSKYKYPHMLVSTIIEGAHHQRFFAEHLPKLTDVIKGRDAVTEFYQEMVFNAIKSEK